MALFRPYERTEKSKTEKSGDETSGDAVSKLVPSSKTAETTKRASVKPAPAVAEDAPAVAEKITVTRTGVETGTESDSSAPLPRGYTPKKGSKTPTRAEAEAARQERLNPTLSSKDRKQKVREANRLARVEAFAKQEDEPTRVLLRDYIDTRWTATEFLIPVMLLLLAANLYFIRNFAATQIVSVAVFVVFLIWLVNVTIVWRGFKKFARERLKNPNFRGLLMYGNSRMMTIRRFRRPGPRIERGAEI